MYTVAAGNPVEGYTLTGVFKTMEEAFLYAERTFEDFTIMEIYPQEATE
jgi:hypothetical protein